MTTDMPVFLKRIIEKEIQDRKIQNSKKYAAEISQHYQSHQWNKTRFLQDPEHCVIYAATRMPATFGAVRSVLDQARLLDGFNPASLIDAGSGTGTVLWACSGLFDFESVLCLEREKNMALFAQSVLSESHIVFKNPPVWKEFDLTVSDIQEKADLVTASYVLNEVEPDRLEHAVLSLWNAANEALILIDPATPKDFERIKTIRHILIKAGAFIAAPCPHNSDCLNDWCHFSCRIARSKMHRHLKNADVPFEDEKFTYLIATRKRYPSCKARVIRSPLIEKGRVSLTLCTPEGLEQKTVSKKEKELYKRVRKINWGDPFDPGINKLAT